MTTEPKDQPLRAEVIEGRIVISIGVETLKYCHNENEKEAEPRKGYGTGFLIADANGFAEDVVGRMMNEREGGSTILTDLLDKATLDAANDGSIHTEERFAWFCGYCKKGMPDSVKGYAHNDGVCYCSEECAVDRDAKR